MQFCEQLRQPLCLAMLRNCTSAFDEAYSAAARLFMTILLQPKLRWGMAWRCLYRVSPCCCVCLLSAPPCRSPPRDIWCCTVQCEMWTCVWPSTGLHTLCIHVLKACLQVWSEGRTGSLLPTAAAEAAGGGASRSWPALPGPVSAAGAFSTAAAAGKS